MKKKLMCMLLVFGLVFALGACDQGYEINEDLELNSPEDGPYDLPDNDSSHGLDLLVWEPKEGNNSNFFLLRDGVNYSLSTIDPEKANGVLPYTDLRMGYDKGCYVYSDLLTSLPDSVNNGFFSYGNIPVPTYEHGDKIVSYSSSSVPNMGLRRVNFYGDAIRLHTITLNSGRYDILDDEQGASFLFSDNVEIKDSKGNVISDIPSIYNLNEGEDYIVSWYEGTQYREVTLPADSKYYVLARDRLDDPEYIVSGTLTKDGYAEYDISGVESGTYVVTNADNGGYHGLITIE